MYVAYTAAHWPMHALEHDIAKYEGKYDGGYDDYLRQRQASATVVQKHEKERKKVKQPDAPTAKAECGSSAD